MFIFGLTIFSGAFLLFLVQPLMAKFILPWFGGSPAVWTTCLLFFQVLLLGGYAYAHWIISRLSPHRQVVVHLTLLGVALLLLPIAPADAWKPLDGSSPAWRILLLLTACLGLPYLVLSATGPLMQAWFSRAHPGVSPYRLYALSNVGSLLALIGYPLLLEPNLPRQSQAVWWSLGLVGFALLALGCGVTVWRRAESSSPVLPSGGTATEPAAEPVVQGRWLWFALPACATVMLLAVTNKLCGDIAVIPFLWVLPLSLYLLTFIVTFDRPCWYWRPLWLPLLALALAAAWWMTYGASATVPTWPVLRPLLWLHQQAYVLSFPAIIGIYLVVLFVGCLVCHGEVYRRRPPARQLTGYYLMIAAGGAGGGLFVAVVAPLIFHGYFELPAGLLALALLVSAALFVDNQSPLYRGRPVWAWVMIGLALVGFGAGLFLDAASTVQGALVVTRNFYGVLKIHEYNVTIPEWREITLVHGSTIHGVQYLDPEKRRWPTSYYVKSSGIGLVMEHFPRTNRRVGVVGLGAGCMAAWSRPGDYFRFYEINAEVERLARNHFFYLADSPAKIEVILGDARLSLEREPGQQFDVLVLDAFSSDAIPVHLLTREAFEIYRRHLKPDGVLAVHVSNQYLNLVPVVRRAAEHLAFGVALVRDDGQQDNEELDWNDYYSSDWMLLSRNQAFLKLPAIEQVTTLPRRTDPTVDLWTDEANTLLRILTLK
ncbi:MAG: fused MFS/spermidine synthase [Verrucomicrobiota bacterium]